MEQEEEETYVCMCNQLRERGGGERNVYTCVQEEEEEEEEVEGEEEE